MQKTLILTSEQINQKVNRIAFQIYEDNYNEKEILLAGIDKSGFLFAQMLAKKVEEISPLKTLLFKVKINKDDPENSAVSFEPALEKTDGKVIVMIDDVLNSGRVMFHAMAPLMKRPLKKLRTALLVNRNHKNFPVSADFVGLTIATTLKEQIEVDLSFEKEAAYLI
jgi:pyrimidine operon attenuation protein / uracil phosphoribosyltransferase